MNAFVSPRFRLGWILVLIGLVNALFWTGFRWYYENQFNRAQITLDYEDTRLLADSYGTSQLALLKDFRDAGARSLAVFDQTLANLQGSGRLTIMTREEAERLYPKANWKGVPEVYRQFVSSTDGDLLASIRPRLAEQSGPVKPQTVLLKEGRSTDGLAFGLALPASKELVNDALLGFDPQHLAMAKAANLGVTARISNPLNLTPARLKTLLDDCEKAHSKVILMAEDEVLGYQTMMSIAAREMRERKLIFSNIEFSKQRGAEDFALSTEGWICRVHSVSGDEAAKAKPEMIVDRYVRAARERDIRVLYIRLLRQVKGQPVLPGPSDTSDDIRLEKSSYQQNLELIKTIRDELESPTPIVGSLRTSLHMGQAQPFGNYPMDQLEHGLGHRGAQIARYLMLFLSGLGTVGGTILLINLCFDLSSRAKNAWLALGVFMVAGMAASPGMGAKLMALQAGMALPMVAVIWGGLPLVWDGTRSFEGPRTPARVSWFAAGLLVKSTLITLVGGFFVVAFLNNWKYMSKADEFLGEKATQFLPLLLLPLIFAGELFPHRVESEGSAAGRQLAKRRILGALARPFDARTAILSVVFLGVVYLWMARFGNESGMEISPMELKMRALLEKVFITRPRTKEIFMGHPAFLFTVYFLLRRRRPLAFLCFFAAVIGQTDALNSMCHIHTPVFYCIWRTITGVFIGTVVGFAGLVIIDRLWARFEKRADSTLNGSTPSPPGSLPLTPEKVV